LSLERRGKRAMWKDIIIHSAAAEWTAISWKQRPKKRDARKRRNQLHNRGAREEHKKNQPKLLLIMGVLSFLPPCDGEE
jgi:hypothetical protein